MTKELENKIQDFINNLYTDKTDDEKYEIAKFVSSILFMKSDNILPFNMMSDYGLVYEINKEVLHKYGLALAYNLDTNMSNGCLISKDGTFSFSDETIKKREKQLLHFKNNYRDLLG